MLTPSSVVASLRRPRANHFVINGFDGLAYRLAGELTRRYGADVVVLMTPEQRRQGRDFADLPRVRVVVCERIDERAFVKADLATASGLALVLQDDVSNIHVALLARDLAPEQRLVVRMYNSQLGRGIEALLGNCSVLSDAEIAAPALTALALDELSVSPLPVSGRTLTVARRGEVPPGDIVCGLASTSGGNGPELLPVAQEQADLVLADFRAELSVADTVSIVGARMTRHAKRWRLSAVLRTGRTLVSRRVGLATAVVLGLLLVSGTALSIGMHLPPWEGAYVTMVNAFGGPQQDDAMASWLQAVQLVVGLCGLALVPLATAMVVEGMVNARLAVIQGRLRQPVEDHVVVIGLGNVGTRVIRLLHDRGIEVVAIDRDENARGMPLARELGIPVIIGDASRESTLRSAAVDKCRAMMALASNDAINLEAALHGRNIKPKLRVVVRLFDGDLASRVRRTFNIVLSRSVSYVAAPAFAEALMDREVIGTIAVERRVLLLAELIVAAGSPLDGQPLAVANIPGEVRVIAQAPFGEPRPQWTPSGAKVIAPRDRLTVIGTRDGLSRLVQQVAPPGTGASTAR